MKNDCNKRTNLFEERCKTCFYDYFDRLFEKFDLKKTDHQSFFDFTRETIESNKKLSSPGLQRELNNRFCKMIGISDPYYDEKVKSNQMALEIYGKWKQEVLASDDPFDLALRLTIAGNIMDYGAHDNFDIEKTIERVLTSHFALDHSADLIISKGQGNLEGLMFENDPRIFFLLMAKCDVVAERLGVEKGSFICNNDTGEI